MTVGPGCEGVDRSSEVTLKALNAIKEQVPGVVEELLFGLEAARAFNILVLFDSGVDLFDHRGLVWRACSNVDAERDIHVSGRRILVDVCTKGPWDGHFREWPEEPSFNRADMS
jgi:4-hydroxy-3-polyprenylbenzoate decarboxylase